MPAASPAPPATVGPPPDDLDAPDLDFDVTLRGLFRVLWGTP